MFEFGIATVLLIGTILIGFPIAFSIGITTVIYILMTNPANISAIPIRMFSCINSFTLMALPLFMLAAEIMIRTGFLQNFLTLCVLPDLEKREAAWPM